MEIKMDKKELTSLDWVRDSIDIDKHNLRIYTEDLDVHNMQNITQELKYLKMIETDLEVLQILKKYINLGFLSATFKDHQHWITGGYITKEDYDKIKEWLENGINNK